MSTHKVSRKNAPTVTAIIAGEPTTIAAGDRVTINWTRYGTEAAGTTHTEGAADRHPRGFFVALVSADLVDRSGRSRGPAVRLDGQVNVKPRNVLAVIDEKTGEVIGRWLPLYRANGAPTTQLVSVEATA